jgi:hypothetical protein
MLQIGPRPAQMRLAASVMALATLLIASGAAGDTAPRQLRVSNHTALSMVNFYAADTRQPDWNDDRLGAGVLAPGASVVVTLGARQGECFYDLRAVFEDGRAETAHRVNVCETQSWDYQPAPSA